MLVTVSGAQFNGFTQDVSRFTVYLKESGIVLNVENSSLGKVNNHPNINLVQ